MNTYQWDWTTIAALVAPRPLLFANSDEDKIFPMDGNRRVMAKLRQVYKMYDKPDLVDEYINKGGHDDRADLRVAAFQWMNKHLKNDTTPVKYEAFKQLPGKELRVFPEEKDVPKDALNGKIDETFVKRAEVKLPEKGHFAEWKKGMIDRLKEKCFRSFPETIPAAKAVTESPLGGEDMTEPGIRVTHYPLVFLKEGKVKGQFERLPTVEGLFMVVQPDDFGPERDDLDRVRKKLGTDLPSWAIHPRGAYHEWTQKSPPNYVERSHALLGLKQASGRGSGRLASRDSYVGNAPAPPHCQRVVPARLWLTHGSPFFLRRALGAGGIGAYIPRLQFLTSQQRSAAVRRKKIGR